MHRFKRQEQSSRNTLPFFPENNGSGPFYPGGRIPGGKPKVKKMQGVQRRDPGQRALPHRNPTEAAMNNRLRNAQKVMPKMTHPIAIQKKGESQNRIGEMRKAVAGRLGKSGGLRNHVSGLVAEALDKRVDEQGQVLSRKSGRPRPKNLRPAKSKGEAGKRLYL